MEVEIYVQGEISQDALERMFQRALANSLDVPIHHIVTLFVRLSSRGSGPGLRRLQSLLARQYEIAYEVIVPSSEDPNLVMEKANRIAVAGSAESQVFRQELIATDGVEQVRQVVMKVSPYVLDDKTRTPPPSSQFVVAFNDDDSSSWRSVAFGLIAVVSCLCLVPGIVWIRRMILAFKES